MFRSRLQDKRYGDEIGPAPPRFDAQRTARRPVHFSGPGDRAGSCAVIWLVSHLPLLAVRQWPRSQNRRRLRRATRALNADRGGDGAFSGATGRRARDTRTNCGRSDVSKVETAAHAVPFSMSFAKMNRATGSPRKKRCRTPRTTANGLFVVTKVVE